METLLIVLLLIVGANVVWILHIIADMLGLKNDKEGSEYD